MITEKEIRNYLKNRKQIRENLNSKLSSLREDVDTLNSDFQFTLPDISLNTTSLIISSNSKQGKDLSDAIEKYDTLLDKIISSHIVSVNKMTTLLSSLHQEKQLYDNIDYQIHLLDSREATAVRDLCHGLKVSDIAAHLDCSYNTARDVLSRGIHNIFCGLADENW